jgi:hypothetical protein
MTRKLKRAAFRDAVEEIETLPAERQSKIREGARGIVEATHLAEIRRLMDMTQARLSAATGMKQAEISRIEKSPERAQLQTIERYARGLGGAVSVVVEFPDGTRAHLPVARGRLVKQGLKVERGTDAGS